MPEQFDLAALEKALSKKERKKQETSKGEEKPKRRNPDKPLFTPIDAEGKEIAVKDMKVGKIYGLKKNK